MALDDVVMDSTRFSDTLRLTDIKESRKQTEKDWRLLNNRIAFLKKEEIRLSKEIKKTQELACKKIEEKDWKNSTKLDKRRTSAEKTRFQDKKSREIKEKRAKHIDSIQKIVRERRNKSLIDAKTIKDESKEIKEVILTQKLEENLRKLSSRHKVLADKKMMTEKRKLEELKSKSISMAKYNNKIAEEIIKKQMIEESIEKMSFEERDIIQRIQVTQLLCRSINEKQVDESI